MRPRAELIISVARGERLLEIPISNRTPEL
jgi:hypothetical protein